MNYKDVWKRVLDVVLSGTGLLILLPCLALLALCLWALNRGNPFFVQQRPGKDEKLFALIKFKTMMELKNEKGELLPDEERLTPWGDLLRRTSLDEWPQLWNVLKGDMSLVGPRPLLPRHLLRYHGEQKRRHEVRPGMTGWAQVNGRTSIPLERKLEYDLWYVDHLSFCFDMKILGLTLFNIFERKK